MVRGLFLKFEPLPVGKINVLWTLLYIEFNKSIYYFIMKKIILTAAVVGMLTFTACGSDDDSGEDAQVCETCTIDFLGITTVTEYCDNEDGTVTATVDGVEEIVDLMGISFSQFITSVELLGTCNPS